LAASRNSGIVFLGGDEDHCEKIVFLGGDEDHCEKILKNRKENSHVLGFSFASKAEAVQPPLFCPLLQRFG
jgi:hypothetical protein